MLKFFSIQLSLHFLLAVPLTFRLLLESIQVDRKSLISRLPTVTATTIPPFAGDFAGCGRDDGLSQRPGFVYRHV